MTTFVFISGITGPQPQVWYDDQVTGEGKEKTKPLFSHKLTELEEYDLSIGRLTLDKLQDRYRDQLVSSSEPKSEGLEQKVS